MKKKITSLLLGLLVCALLVPGLTRTAWAKDYDEIVNYDITVQPNVDDGSLNITMAFDWKALEKLPYGQELKIGVPNGSIRDARALTDNIERLEYDNSYMYVYLTQGYGTGETFRFAYSWTQEYMYSLGDDGSVSYAYTPGWFDEAKVDRMSVTWEDPAGVGAVKNWSADDGSLWSASGNTVTGTKLPHGAQIRLEITYPDWPVALDPAHGSSNIPDPDPYYPDYPDYPDYEDDSGRVMFYFILVMIIVFILVIKAASRRDHYAGGFGTHYVFVNNLWYPAGADGKPKPGSTGLAHKPKPPASSHSGHSGGLFGGSGFGGGKHGGGGFGGGGFGGGSHCACASSCACACACACAGGGRAGCSAKNLYGAIHLNEEMSRRLEERTDD